MVETRAASIRNVSCVSHLLLVRPANQLPSRSALILAIVRDAAQINLLPYMPRLNFNSGGFFDEASKNTVHLAFTTESRARYISDMLLRIADATAVVAFVEIGNGFIFALYRQRTSSQKTLRWIAIPVVGVLVLLAIVLAGVYNVDVYRHDKRLIDIGMGSETLSSSSYFDFDEIVAKIRIFQYMEGVCSVLNFILAQGVLVQACVVMHRYTRIAQAKGVRHWDLPAFLAGSIRSFPLLTWSSYIVRGNVPLGVHLLLPSAHVVLHRRFRLGLSSGRTFHAARRLIHLRHYPQHHLPRHYHNSSLRRRLSQEDWLMDHTAAMDERR